MPPTPSKSSLTAGETRHLNLPGPFKNRVRHLRDALPPSGRTSGTRRTRSAARTMPQGTGSEALARLVAAVAKGQKTRPPTRCPVHHLSHLLLRRFHLQYLPLAACAHSLQRVVLVVALSSIIVGCLPMVSQVAFATITPPHLSSYSAG